MRDWFVVQMWKGGGGWFVVGEKKNNERIVKHWKKMCDQRTGGMVSSSNNTVNCGTYFPLLAQMLCRCGRWVEKHTGEAVIVDKLEISWYAFLLLLLLCLRNRFWFVTAACCWHWSNHRPTWPSLVFVFFPLKQLQLVVMQKLFTFCNFSVPVYWRIFALQEM